MKNALSIFNTFTFQNNVVLTSLLFFSTFCGVILVAYIFWYVMLWLSARHWQQFDAKLITYRKISNKYSSDIKKMMVVYRFYIDDKELNGTKYQLGFHRDRPHSVNIVDNLDQSQEDKLIKIYVNPKSTAQTTLDREFDFFGIVFLIGLALLCFSIFIFI